PVTFRNYENDQVIIDGSGTSTSDQGDVIRISNQSFVRLMGLEIANNTSKAKDGFITGIGIWGKGEGIEILDCKIHEIRYSGGTDSSDESEGAGARAIAVYGMDGSEPISGLVIDGNEIWDVSCGAGEAVTVSGNVDGFEFTNNYVHDTDSDGLVLVGDGKLKGKAVCTPAAQNRARNGFVGYNKMERNSRRGNPDYPGNWFNAGGIYANGAENVTIAYNTCRENDLGIKVGSEAREKVCQGITVRDNLIYGNLSSGILAGGNDMNRGWASNCKFLNNTLYNNDTEKSGSGEINLLKSRGIFFSSNIVYTGPQNLTVVKSLGPEYAYDILFNNNIYYGPGGSRSLRFTGPDTGSVGLNMWIHKTKQDSSSKVANPRFADAPKGDFNLLGNSPAIDFGDRAYVPAEGEKDFGGNPRVNGRAVDCGAYEH
nr:right-handed parallel beta-helix repeat-containing protein [Bacillota bacterium]